MSSSYKEWWTQDMQLLCNGRQCLTFGDSGCRFQYGSVPLYNEHLMRQTEENAQLEGHNRQPPASLPAAFRGDLAQDDAFSTVMQWLYARMDAIQRP